MSNECRENIALLKQTILSILSAVSGVAASELFLKINYQMTDAASHDLHVDEIVAMELVVGRGRKIFFAKPIPA